jgi:4-carboxymuconolactone decarboxylase
MRLIPITPGRLTGEQRGVYDAILGGPRGPGFAAADGHLTGPFNAMLYNPAIGGPLQELGAALRYHGNLDDRARELAIVTVAVAYRAEFEWATHSRIAAGLGVDAATLERIRQGDEPDLDDPTEAIVLEVVRALLDRVDVGDELYARAVDAIGEGGLVELTTLVGYYGTLALQMRLFRVPLPDGEHSVLE